MLFNEHGHSKAEENHANNKNELKINKKKYTTN